MDPLSLLTTLSWPLRRGLSTRVYLVAFVVVLLGPGLLFTGVLLDRYGRAERERVRQDARESVRQVATAIDRDVVALQATLEVLAISPDIQGGDLERFEARARQVRGFIGLDIVLRRVSDGQQLVNTRLAPGAALPKVDAPHDADVLAARRPAVTGVFVGPSAPGPVYVISVPVMRGGALDQILSFVVPTERLRDIMRQELTPGWVATLVDRTGRVLARSENNEDWSGKEAPPYLDPEVEGRGTWSGTSRDGRDVLFATTQVMRSGWTVVASVPRGQLDARLQTWMTMLLGFGLGTLALSSFFAVRLWSVVERPIRQLAASGEALSRGEAFPAIRTPIREIRHLAEALNAAATATKARIAERDRALAEQARGLAALRESEARFRHMADSAPALIWMTDAEGRITFLNLHYDHVFGVPGDKLLGEGWRDIVVAEDLPDFAAAFNRAFERRDPFRGKVRVRDRHGAVRWFQCEGVPRLDDQALFLGYTGCNVDVTDVHLAQDQQQLLINELNHRVKNTLATVQSIAAQSLRGLRSREAHVARDAFEARLMALARAHDVLTRSHWEGATLDGVVADALAPVEPPGRPRVRVSVSGPGLWVPPRMALPIAMALHELLTNAVKYGALSVTAGRVTIRWQVVRSGEGARLHLEWRETGGPPVRVPEQRGFGSRLIERGLAHELDGRVELRFDPRGVVCVIEAPLPADARLLEAALPPEAPEPAASAAVELMERSRRRG